MVMEDRILLFRFVQQFDFVFFGSLIMSRYLFHLITGGPLSRDTMQRLFTRICIKEPPLVKDGGVIKLYFKTSHNFRASSCSLIFLCNTHDTYVFKQSLNRLQIHH